MAHAGGKPRKAITLPILPAGKAYLTVPELEELTGIHHHTIQARLRDGTIKGKKIGKEWRIYPDSLVPAPGK